MNQIIIAHIEGHAHLHSGDAVAAVLLTAVLWIVVGIIEKRAGK